jgi:hypothetical protein
VILDITIETSVVQIAIGGYRQLEYPEADVVDGLDVSTMVSVSLGLGAAE